MQQSVTDAREPSPNDGEDCYYCRVFNFGRPKTSGQWIGHIAMAIIALAVHLRRCSDSLQNAGGQ